MSFKFTSIRRVIRSGIINFRRNQTVSLASVLVMTITLSVLAGLVFAQASLQHVLNDIKSKADISVYILVGTPEADILALKEQIEAVPEVAEVRYESAADALIAFRERHANDFATLRALDEVGTNPLNATLNIVARDPSQYESVAKLLEQQSALEKGDISIIDRINYSQNKVVIDRLNVIIQNSNRLGFLITFFLIITSVMITFNTVRLAIFISREEISIMRLVGAERQYIRGPFIVEGMLVGVIAAGLTMLLYWPITAWFGARMTDFLGLNLFSYYLDNFVSIFLILFGTGIFLGTLASILAIRKYLKE